jgi:hypothetical protein
MPFNAFGIDGLCPFRVEDPGGASELRSPTQKRLMPSASTLNVLKMIY